jgi:FeS assembly SUF system protein
MQPPADPSTHISLPVLSSSAKLEELRAQAQSEPRRASPDGTAASASAGDASSIVTSHVNRFEREGREPQGLEAKIVAAIREVYDPEIPINIYDLGLIYDIQIDPENRVKVKMTLTAPGCPVAGILPMQAQSRVECVAEVTSAEVELVWDPPWTKEMMSEVARVDLGL